MKKMKNDSSDYDSKPLIIIAGMHRSGTSFLSRSLNLTGIYMGDIESIISHEWPFNESNPSGHWENRKIVELTEKTLRENGGNWFEIPKKIIISDELGQEIKNVIIGLQSHSSIAIGFKDPRILLCLDSWQDYLPKNLIIIGIFRHPLKVAESLKKRDGFDYQKSLDLWKTHNQKLLDLLDKYKGFLLNFDWPKDKIISEINMIVDKLGLIRNENLSKWYSEELLRSNETFESKHTTQPEIDVIYSRLIQRSSQNQSVSIPKITHTEKELEAIIQGLIYEINSQDEYFKRLEKQNKFLEKTLVEDLHPMSSLLAEYFKRPDLKNVFPEVHNGEYTRLVNWAIEDCENQPRGEEKTVARLSKHLSWYKNYLSTKSSDDKIKVLQEELTSFRNQLSKLKQDIEEKEESIKNLHKIEQDYHKVINDLSILREQYATTTESLFKERIRARRELEKIKFENRKYMDDVEHLRSLSEQQKRTVSELTSSYEVYKKELESIQNSVGFKILKKLSKKLDVLAPSGTLREQMKKITIASLWTINEKGFQEFLRDIQIKIKRREFKILETPKEVADIPLTSFNPADLPVGNYLACETWMSRYQPKISDISNMAKEIRSFKYQPKISIVMPVYNPPEKYLGEALDSVINQIYQNWEIIAVNDGSTNKNIQQILKSYTKKDSRIHTYEKENEGIPKTLNYGFTRSTGEYVVIVDNDDILEPHALFELVQFLNIHGNDWNLIYSDEVLLNDSAKPFALFFRPDFSPDLFFSHQYFVHMVATKRTVLEEIGGTDESFPNVSWDYDLWGRIVVKDFKKVGHIPKVLYRWRRYKESTSTQEVAKVMEQSKIALRKLMKMLDIKGEVYDGLKFNLFRIKRDLKNEKLSIIILTRDPILTRQCIDSIENKTTYKNYEIIILANNLKNEEDKIIFDEMGLKHKVVYYNKPFNFSQMNNYAAKIASGDHLLFLNDDTEIISEGSIEAMLEHSQRKEVGAVGAKLLFYNNTIQHSGVVMGLFDSCEHIFKFGDDTPQYLEHNFTIRNYSAVTAAAIMVPRRVFEEVGGFDEKLAIVFNDIDLCLRIREKGYLIVYTPYATFYHYEHATRKDGKSDLHPAKEDMMFKQRWKNLIMNDPYYNPNLSRYHYDSRPRFDK